MRSLHTALHALSAAVLLCASFASPTFHTAAHVVSKREVDIASTGSSGWLNCFLHPITCIRQSTERDIVESDGLPSDIWEKMIALGDNLNKVSQNMLDDASKKFSDAKTKIDEFKGLMHEVMTATGELHAYIPEVLDATQYADNMDMVTKRGESMSTSALTLEDLSAEIARLYQNVLEELQNDFPPPDKAPSHANRQMMVESVLQRAEDNFIELFRNRGVSTEKLDSTREKFGNIRAPVAKLTVIVGDLVEQHPVILETLLFTGAALLIPEGWLLRPLLSLFGFGPTGPAKGSIAAWAQRRFWGAAVSSGSWYAWLQRAGMKPMSWWELLRGILHL